MTCNDLRLGGTLSAAGISGGTSINSTALMVADWSLLLGSPGISATAQVVNGRPGALIAGDQLTRERYPTLNMRLTNLGPAITLVEPTADEQLQANTDDFLGLVTNPAGNYLEVDMPDLTSRYLYVYNLDPALMRQPRAQRTISVPLVGIGGYWKQGGTQESQVVNGAGMGMTVGGNRQVYDPVLVFSGNGTFSHDTEGWSIQVTGSAGPVTVDLGNRTVTEGGLVAVNRIRRNNRNWGWLNPGANSVTSTVSVTVTWRSSWA